MLDNDHIFEGGLPPQDLLPEQQKTAAEEVIATISKEGLAQWLTRCRHLQTEKELQDCLAPLVFIYNNHKHKEISTPSNDQLVSFLAFLVRHSDPLKDPKVSKLCCHVFKEIETKHEINGFSLMVWSHLVYEAIPEAQKSALEPFSVIKINLNGDTEDPQQEVATILRALYILNLMLLILENTENDEVLRNVGELGSKLTYNEGGAFALNPQELGQYSYAIKKYGSEAMMKTLEQLPAFVHSDIFADDSHVAALINTIDSQNHCISAKLKGTDMSRAADRLLALGHINMANTVFFYSLPNMRTYQGGFEAWLTTCLSKSDEELRYELPMMLDKHLSHSLDYAHHGLFVDNYDQPDSISFQPVKEHVVDTYELVEFLIFLVRHSRDSLDSSSAASSDVPVAQKYLKRVFDLFANDGSLPFADEFTLLLLHRMFTDVYRFNHSSTGDDADQTSNEVPPLALNCDVAVTNTSGYGRLASLEALIQKAILANRDVRFNNFAIEKLMFYSRDTRPFLLPREGKDDLLPLSLFLSDKEKKAEHEIDMLYGSQSVAYALKHLASIDDVFEDDFFESIGELARKGFMVKLRDSDAHDVLSTYVRRGSDEPQISVASPNYHKNPKIHRSETTNLMHQLIGVMSDIYAHENNLGVLLATYRQKNEQELLDYVYPLVLKCRMLEQFSITQKTLQQFFVFLIRHSDPRLNPEIAKYAERVLKLFVSTTSPLEADGALLAALNEKVIEAAEEDPNLIEIAEKLPKFNTSLSTGAAMLNNEYTKQLLITARRVATNEGEAEIFESRLNKIFNLALFNLALFNLALSPKESAWAHDFYNTEGVISLLEAIKQVVLLTQGHSSLPLIDTDLVNETFRYSKIEQWDRNSQQELFDFLKEQGRSNLLQMFQSRFIYENALKPIRLEQNQLKRDQLILDLLAKEAVSNIDTYLVKHSMKELVQLFALMSRDLKYKTLESYLVNMIGQPKEKLANGSWSADQHKAASKQLESLKTLMQPQRDKDIKQEIIGAGGVLNCILTRGLLVFIDLYCLMSASAQAEIITALRNDVSTYKEASALETSLISQSDVRPKVATARAPRAFSATTTTAPQVSISASEVSPQSLEELARKKGGFLEYLKSHGAEQFVTLLGSMKASDQTRALDEIIKAIPTSQGQGKKLATNMKEVFALKKLSEAPSVKARIDKVGGALKYLENYGPLSLKEAYSRLDQSGRVEIMEEMFTALASKQQPKSAPVAASSPH